MVMLGRWKPRISPTCNMQVIINSFHLIPDSKVNTIIEPLFPQLLRVRLIETLMILPVHPNFSYCVMQVPLSSISQAILDVTTFLFWELSFKCNLLFSLNFSVSRKWSSLIPAHTKNFLPQ